MRKKRFIAMLAAILVIACALSASAFADTPQNWDIQPNLSEGNQYVFRYFGQERYVQHGTVISRTYNSTHESVIIAQWSLFDYSEYNNYVNMNPGKPDGIFGYNTESAVIAFQSHWGLSADGWIGDNTWAKLSDCVCAIN